MKFRYIVGFIILLIGCSCIQRNSKSKALTHIKPNQHRDWKSGLRIENGPIKGFSYTDSLGIEFGHAHKTITIYNDSTVSVNIQMDLLKAYNFPAPYNDEKFKVVIWPQELTTNMATPTDSLSDQLQNFLQTGSDANNHINISIAPHEKSVFTLGTLVDISVNYYTSPNVLYVQCDGSIPWDCKNLTDQDESNTAPLAIGLRLDSPDVGCTVITCGLISYPEH